MKRLALFLTASLILLPGCTSHKKETERKGVQFPPDDEGFTHIERPTDTTLPVFPTTPHECVEAECVESIEEH